MQLYFTPMSCSLATRIALYECGGDHSFIHVAADTRNLPDGSDYRAIEPVGLVPLLRDGELLVHETAAILQYVARKYGRLAPRDELGTMRLQEWLSFIGAELHKLTFQPLLDKASNEGAQRFALHKSGPRLTRVADHLRDREFLLDELSVADAYLTTALVWARATPIKLEEWPPLVAYLQRMRARPAVQRALAEEFQLYQQEQAAR